MKEMTEQHLFEKLIGEHKGIIYKVARTYCSDQEDRDDLIQEILIQLWQSYNKYDKTYQLSTWMYRIALNVAISFYRKYGLRKGQVISLSEEISQIQEAEKSEKEYQLNLLEQFIQELNELDKALMLLYLEDKSHAEIATILGISVSNVSTKAARIRQKLKQKFKIQNTDSI